jgi:hypothetical protein
VTQDHTQSNFLVESRLSSKPSEGFKKTQSHSESRRNILDHEGRRGFTTESMLNSSFNRIREKSYRHPRISSNKRLDKKLKVFNSSLQNIRLNKSEVKSHFSSVNLDASCSGQDLNNKVLK